MRWSAMSIGSRAKNVRLGHRHGFADKDDDENPHDHSRRRRSCQNEARITRLGAKNRDCRVASRAGVLARCPRAARAITPERAM